MNRRLFKLLFCAITLFVYCNINSNVFAINDDKSNNISVELGISEAKVYQNDKKSFGLLKQNEVAKNDVNFAKNAKNNIIKQKQNGALDNELKLITNNSNDDNIIMNKQSFKDRSKKQYDDKKQKTVLQVATNVPFPPFEMMQNGKIVGIDVDILQAISEITGIHFEIVDMSFNSIIASLNSGKVQMAIAGLTATNERREKVDFTDNYFNSRCSLIVNSERSSSLKEMYGKKVGVQTGTVMQDFLQKYNTMLKTNDKIKIVFFDDNYVGMELLINQKIDAVLIDEMVGKAYAKVNQNIHLTRVNCEDDKYGTAIALTKKSPHTDTINSALRQLKKNGSLKKIIDKWETKYIDKILEEDRARRYNQALKFIVKGSLLTIKYAVCSIVIGVIFSIFLTLMIYSGKKTLYYVVKIYVSIIRGTPMLLQFSFIYFGVSHLLNTNLSVFTAGVIAFSMNSAGYLVEIIRSGVRSIDKGQIEACKSLNLSRYQMIKDVMMPQVVHNIFPALINEFITLIKESSIVSVFGGYEITKRANMVIAEYYSYFVPLIVAGLSYYIMTFSLELFANWWEKRYKY